MGNSFVLASGSASRQAMLRDAGVSFEIRVPDVDEAAAKLSLIKDGASPEVTALALANLKAVSASVTLADEFVLGADQILECEGRLFSKATGEKEARNTLIALRGKSHRLISAAVLARNGAPLWRSVEAAELTMRDFSDSFLDAYLAAEGRALLGSVGCYRIEGMGARLFSSVSGDQFVVRGMPLLAVLGALRTHGVLTT